jgi:hypothetical protein
MAIRVPIMAIRGTLRYPTRPGIRRGVLSGRCVDCPEFLCVKCAAVHTKMRLTATHRLVDLSTVRARACAAASVPVSARAHVRVRACAYLRISTGSAAAGCACMRVSECPQARLRLRNPAAIPSAPPAGGCRGVTDGCAAHPGAPLLLWYAPVRRQPTRV